MQTRSQPDNKATFYSSIANVLSFHTERKYLKENVLYAIANHANTAYQDLLCTAKASSTNHVYPVP